MTPPNAHGRPHIRVELLSNPIYLSGARELVGTVAVAVAMRVFADSLGTDVEPVAPAADPGEPTQEVPEGLGDIGAHVRMLDPFPFANVARALSQVPSANMTFYTLVRPLYSAAGFEELVWDTPLSRPQVELIAARVAARGRPGYASESSRREPRTSTPP